jgi:ubiquinone/menaquinone biosynthesis C-methylase UbiE
LSQFLATDTTFLELGPGDCSLAFEVAKFVKKVYAIDVSAEITKGLQKPENFKLIISDGTSVNVPPQSIDIAYSNQLIEHLHPDDALEQLQYLYKALVPGGIYICISPHQFSGPHDISKYFDNVATGFHIKEYTNKELYDLFKSVGFQRIQSLLFVKKDYIRFSTFYAIFLESILSRFSYSIRKIIAKTIIFRNILTIRLVAKKGPQ